MDKNCQELKKTNSRKRVLSQLFDVRPMKKTGDLDMEKILEVKETLNLRGEMTDKEESLRKEAVKIPVIVRDTEDYVLLLEKDPEEIKEIEPEREPEEQEPKVETPQKMDYRWEDPSLSLRSPSGQGFEKQEKPPVKFIEEVPPKEDILDELESLEYHDQRLKEKMGMAEGQFVEPEIIEPEKEKIEEKQKGEKKKCRKSDSPHVGGSTSYISQLRSVVGFALVTLILSTLMVGSILSIQHFSQTKERIVMAGTRAAQHLQEAQAAAKLMDFSKSSSEFKLAYKNFAAANQSLGGVGRLIIFLLKGFPGGSSLAQGQILLDLGEDIALAGQNLTEGIEFFTGTNILNSLPQDKPAVGLTGAIIGSAEKFKVAQIRLLKAQEKLKKIDFEKLPEEFRASIENLQSQLPQIQGMLKSFIESESILLEILGHETPRKYLLLFQNNGEMRPTGGFLGTYGILDFDEGIIEKLFVEGIYHPDGQLSVKVVPPKPIQKISAAWSMHDANWFADFPASAQKVAWFYEKTGGPTVDGVIALTNEMLIKLLDLTGPIDMPSYGVVIDSNNFIEKTQYLVEVAYDEEENRPKQFIADLAPKILERVFNASPAGWFGLSKVLGQALKEKHILLFFFDEELEEKIREKGWAGEVIDITGDYFSVVNANINGYKTDAVMEEEISHLAEIKKDGSIIDTLTITRRHLGGETHYDWWNRVNSNWLRVYLPKGAELLEAKGHTLEEEYIPTIDYSWFMRDPLVEEIESTMIRDGTGTYIFEESGKTVFGNWVYVSPGEEVTVTYKYKLPFKIDISQPADSYSLLVQKQSGSRGSKFKGEIKFPKGWEVIQSTSEDLGLETDLSLDRFYGVTFGF